MTHFGELWLDIAHAVLPVMQRYRRDTTGLSISQKRDGTLLTAADLEVQDLIVDALLRYDPLAEIVAEEGFAKLAGDNFPERLWVIDPIDGTSQFADNSSVEFCSVVAVLEAGWPAACMILAPELRPGRAPLLITSPGEGRAVLLDGVPAAPAPRTQNVAATRSRTAPVAPIESAAVLAGFAVKTSGTSQTLDMARTALDLTSATGLSSFRWFVASNQLLWDAAAGLTLAGAGGRLARDPLGNALDLNGINILGPAAPRIPGTIVATPEDLAWIVAHMV